MSLLYRIENPNIPANPDGINSHAELIGQWFSRDIDYVVGYLRKSQEVRMGKRLEFKPGAKLIILDMPEERIVDYHAKKHPIAGSMDIEDDNYIIPHEIGESLVIQEIDLSDIEQVGGNIIKLNHAKEKIKKRIQDLRIEI